MLCRHGAGDCANATGHDVADVGDACGRRANLPARIGRMVDWAPVDRTGKDSRHRT